MQKTHKIALIVGHTDKRGGALAVAPLSCNEYNYNYLLAKLIQHEFKKLDDMHNIYECKIILRNEIGINGAYTEVNKYGPICSIELHFNSFSDENVRGTETLYTENHKDSSWLANLVQDKICKELDRKEKENRGLKELKKGQRGRHGLIQAKCPAVLVEPFFGSSPKDSKLALEKKCAIANAIRDAIYCFIWEE